MTATTKHQTKMFFNNSNSHESFIFNSLSINTDVSATIMIYWHCKRGFLFFPRKGETLKCTNNLDLYYSVETYGARIESLTVYTGLAKKHSSLIPPWF